MKTIAWLPDNLNANKSFFQFKLACEKAGFTNIPESDFKASPEKACYLILNFYEDIGKKLGFHFISYWGRFFRLKRFIKKGVKVLWFLNNKVPHDDNARWSVKMMKVLIKKSLKIICLCHESEEVIKKLVPAEKIWKDKLIFLPHPNYLGAYKMPEKTVNPEKFTALFFGSIRPYKNVDTLIQTFSQLPSEKVHLIVAGKVKNPEYEKYLKQLASGKDSVDLRLGYVSDDEIMQLILESSVVVLPYDNKTTLNSGSVLLTCSAGKTFVCPKIGTIKDFPDDSLFYSYSYETEEQHRQVLKEKIFQAYEDFEKDPEAFNSKGIKLLEYVKNEHSVEKLGEIIKRELN